MTTVRCGTLGFATTGVGLRELYCGWRSVFPHLGGNEVFCERIDLTIMIGPFQLKETVAVEIAAGSLLAGGCFWPSAELGWREMGQNDHFS